MVYSDRNLEVPKMSQMAFGFSRGRRNKTTNEESKENPSKAQSIPSEFPWLCPSNTLPYQPEPPCKASPCFPPSTSPAKPHSSPKTLPPSPKQTPPCRPPPQTPSGSSPSPPRWPLHGSKTWLSHWRNNTSGTI